MEDEVQHILTPDVEMTLYIDDDGDVDIHIDRIRGLGRVRVFMPDDDPDTCMYIDSTGISWD